MCLAHMARAYSHLQDHHRSLLRDLQYSRGGQVEAGPPRPVELPVDPLGERGLLAAQGGGKTCHARPHTSPPCHRGLVWCRLQRHPTLGVYLRWMRRMDLADGGAQSKGREAPPSLSQSWESRKPYGGGSTPPTFVWWVGGTPWHRRNFPLKGAMVGGNDVVFSGILLLAQTTVSIIMAEYGGPVNESKPIGWLILCLFV